MIKPMHNSRGEIEKRRKRRKTISKFFFGILVIVGVILLVTSSPPQWIVEDNSVYVDDAYVFINVTPHTSNNPVIEFKSKVYTGDVDVVFGFDTDEVVPKSAGINPHYEDVPYSYTCDFEFNYTLAPNYAWCYTNTSYINNQSQQDYEIRVIFDHSFDSGNLNEKTIHWTENEFVWDDVSGAFERVNYEFLDYDTWYYKKDIPINANQTYYLKAGLQPTTMNTGSHKYFFGIKPSGETLQQAIANDHFYYLDPWTTDLNTSLLAYYKLDEESGTTAEDVHGTNDLTASNDGIFTSSLAGRINTGADLNLDYHLSNSTPHSFEGLSAMSISFWADVDWSDCAGWGQFIGSTKDDSATWLIRKDGSNTGFAVLLSTDSDAMNLQMGSSLGDGLFHVVMTWNGTGGTIFVNNTARVTDADIQGTMQTNGKPLYLGAGEGANAGRRMENMMDEVAIWDRALTVAEVGELYNSGLGLSYEIPIVNSAPDSPVLVNPSNASSGEGVPTSLQITIGDADGDSMNVTFYDESDDSVICANNSNIANASTVTCGWAGLSDLTAYNWYANVTDGTETTESSVWNFETSDNTAPSVAWFSQTPSDINILNTITTNAQIIYNISDAGDGLDLSTIKIHYKINNSVTENTVFTNGTSETWFVSKDDASNISDGFTFELDDNEILPATYNLDEETMESAVKSVYDLDGKKEYVMVELFNVSATDDYNILEFYADNQTGLSNSMNIFYCNSTYTTGNPAEDSNCGEVYSLLASETWNHEHSVNSKHYLVSLPFDAGTVSGVDVTSTSYFLFQGTQGNNAWNMYYTTDIAREDACQYTTDEGATWNNLAGTFDAHLHQFNGDEQLSYYACADDVNANQQCTSDSYKSDAYDLTNLNPSGVGITSPTATLYTGIISINWSSAIPSGEAYITNYNLSLLDANQDFVETISGTTANTTLGFNFDSTSVSDGIYYVQIVTEDNNSLISTTISQEFTTDNTAPQITQSISEGQDLDRWGGEGTQFSFYYNVTETNFNSANYTMYFPNGSVLDSNASSGENKTLVYNLLTLGTYQWVIYAEDTAGNFQRKTINFDLVLTDQSGGASHRIDNIIEEVEEGVVSTGEEETFWKKNQTLLIIGGILVVVFGIGRKQTIVLNRKRGK
jgi:hypothetical protein